MILLFLQKTDMGNQITRKSQLQNILGMPAFIWLVFFLLVPFFIVFILSFITRGTYGDIQWEFQFNNYLRVFETVYFKIFFESFKLSLLTAFLCFSIGLPIAWAMATVKSSTRSLLILAMAVPFLTNLMIRVYAIKIFLGIGGPLQSSLQWLGFEFDPFVFSQNKFLVVYGMVTTYLPFFVFPIHSALEKFDFSLVEAAQDLGAGQWSILTKILIPNNRTAISNGLILVFVPCMGEFVIPDLLGGAKSMLVGNLITEQFLKTRDWPFGAALSCVLIIFLLTIPFALRRMIAGKVEK
jgi:spermidine/putrescine transport system permease protein